MKNNTKLIMENWRKFLKEGPGDEDRFVDPNGDIPGVGPDGFSLEEEEPGLGDEDLADIPVSDRDLSRGTFHGAEGVIADELGAGATQSAADKAGIDYARAHGMNAFGESLDGDDDGYLDDGDDEDGPLDYNASDYDGDDGDGPLDYNASDYDGDDEFGGPF